MTITYHVDKETGATWVSWTSWGAATFTSQWFPDRDEAVDATRRFLQDLKFNTKFIEGEFLGFDLEIETEDA